MVFGENEVQSLESSEQRETAPDFKSLQAELVERVRVQGYRARDWLKSHIGENVEFDSWILSGALADDEIDLEWFFEDSYWDKFRVDIVKTYLKAGKASELVERNPQKLLEKSYYGDLSHELQGKVFTAWVDDVGVEHAKKFIEEYTSEGKRKVILDPHIMAEALQTLDASPDIITDFDSMKDFAEVIEDTNSSQKNLWTLSHARSLKHRFDQILEDLKQEQPSFRPDTETIRETTLGAWVHMEKIEEYVAFARELRDPGSSWAEVEEKARQSEYFSNSYIDRIGKMSGYSDNYYIDKIRKQEVLASDLSKKTNAEIGEFVFKHFTKQEPVGLIAATKLFGGGWSFVTTTEEDFSSLANLKRRGRSTKPYHHIDGLNFIVDGVPINISKLISGEPEHVSERLRETLLHEEQHALWSYAPWKNKSDRYSGKVPSEVTRTLTNELSSFYVQSDLRDDFYYIETLWGYLDGGDLKFFPVVTRWLNEVLPLLRTVEPFVKTEDDRAVLGLCLQEGTLEEATQQLKKSVELIALAGREIGGRVTKQQEITKLLTDAPILFGEDSPAFEERYRELESGHQQLLTLLPTLSVMNEELSVRSLLRETKMLDFKAWDAYQVEALSLSEEFENIRQTRQEIKDAPERYNLSDKQVNMLTTMSDLSADKLMNTFKNYTTEQFFLEPLGKRNRISPEQAGIVTSWLTDIESQIKEEVREAEAEGFVSGRIQLGFNLSESQIEVPQMWYERSQDHSALILEAVVDGKKVLMKTRG